MPSSITIQVQGLVLTAELNGSAVAQKILEALPVSAKCNRWGDEIYFRVPLTAEMEDGRDVVEAGDLGYWPPGNAFCIFFGPTPASQGNEIRAASAVQLIGRLVGSLEELKNIRNGAEIVLK
ncbi:MAG: hypothetical protein FJ320_01500 [SAR202 cluster bacterium]|nr:hypothetical protein [SAR202 cluster bacterium]